MTEITREAIIDAAKEAKAITQAELSQPCNWPQKLDHVLRWET